MTSSKWSLYVTRIVGDDEQLLAQDKTQISQGTISRWMRGQSVPTEAGKVAAFAQGYGRSVLEAFVAADMLTLAEVRKSLSPESLALMEDLERALRAKRRKNVSNSLSPSKRAEVDRAKKSARGDRHPRPETVVEPKRPDTDAGHSKRDAG